MDIVKDTSSLKYMESIIRIHLYRFCIFVFMFTAAKSLFPDMFSHKDLFFYVTIGLFIYLACYFGEMLKDEVEHFFHNEHIDWDTKSKSYRLLVNTVRFIGIHLLYYYVQLGILILFFPSLELVLLFNVSFYTPFFLANSFFIYRFYNKYIFDKLST